MRRLSGWKEIAGHLNRGVRTIQRFEKFGLPVYRLRKRRRSVVSAFAEELDAWERSASVSLVEKVGELEAKVKRLENELRSFRSKSRRGRPE